MEVDGEKRQLGCRTPNDFLGAEAVECEEVFALALAKRARMGRRRRKTKAKWPRAKATRGAMCSKMNRRPSSQILECVREEFVGWCKHGLRSDVSRVYAIDLTAKRRSQLGNLIKIKNRSQKKTEEEEHMFQKIAKVSFWLVAALSISLCPVSLQARETAAHPKASAKKIVVTGCLEKGESADEFAITDKNGKSWELRSETVKLAEHVGHTVKITGVRHHETKAEEAKEVKTEGKESKEAEAKEGGDLRVTSLKMIADSCKK